MLNGTQVELPTIESVVPMGGYGVLQPGENYEWVLALPIWEYFPNPGEYKLLLRGNTFESSTISLKIASNR